MMLDNRQQIPETNRQIDRQLDSYYSVKSNFQKCKTTNFTRKCTLLLVIKRIILKYIMRPIKDIQYDYTSL